MFLISGATGVQGNAVARALLRQGAQVRALTRDPVKPAAQALRELGAEIVVGDFGDPDSLRKAAAGTAAVFAMSTSFEGKSETEQAIALLEAAVDAGTQHLVYSSVASALDGTGVPHFESKAAVERRLADLGTPWTVVAPVAFLDNLLAPWSQGALAQGLYTFGLPGDVKLQQVAVADLAAFVAMVLGAPSAFSGKRVEVASVEQTGEELAAALSGVLGRDIRYAQADLSGAGEDLRLMFDFLRETGYRVDIPALHAAYPDISWHTQESWLAAQSWPPQDR